MDRHVEFATQLSRLVALYARHAKDLTTEKAVLRAARAAAKHGEIALSLMEHSLQAGGQALGDENPDVRMLHALFAKLGLTRFEVAHHAEQAEISAIAHLMADAVPDDVPARAAFAKALVAGKWKDIRVKLVGEAEGETSGETTGETTAGPTAGPAAEAAAGTRAESTAAAAPGPAAAEPAAVAPAGAFVSSGPLATSVPAAVQQLTQATHRELFERLITASEPGTLRHLLDPVQLAIEQSLREGKVSEAAQLLSALFACEELATDPDMRRHFVVVFRRLTKPTVLRAFAMLYGDEPSIRDVVHQVLLRFGEDGAEAVADCAACAPGAEGRALYVAWLGRLPGGRDAVVAMLDDQRPHVVERAVGLMVLLRFDDAEKLLAEELAHENLRVRLAAAQGLAAFPTSSFAAAALLRAVEDPAPEVRLSASVALAGRREPHVSAALVKRLDDEPELDVQLALVAALGRLAAPEGVQKLVAMAMPEQRKLRRIDASVLRLGAIEALGEARTPAAMVALQKLLEDSERGVREAAGRLYTRARRHTTTGSIPTVSGP